MGRALCRKCGIVLDAYYLERGEEYHAPCAPASLLFDDPEPVPGLTNGDPYARRLRDDVTEIVLWANRTSTRSQQTELGASEVGVECYRRLGYRIADVIPTNTDLDPWPAIVGTAVHTWLETALIKYEDVHRLDRWHTEMVVRPAKNVLGHTDAYDADFAAVVDWKTANTEKMREYRKDPASIPGYYIDQIHLYGLGHVKAGRRVERVALVFLPRAGWLSGMYVWSAPFDQAIAEAALDKVNKVAAGLIYYKVTEEPGNWEKIPATPTKDCTWCPWFNPEVDQASAAGCPGK